MLVFVAGGLSPIKIRLAREADLEGVGLVEDGSFSEPYPRVLIAGLLRDCPNGFLVAESPQGTVVGYCVAAEGGKWAHLISIGVLREYRRRGIGTALIRRLLANLSSRVKEVRLEVNEGNTEAMMLYEKLGFKQVGSIQNYYKDGSAAAQMLLTFDGAHSGPSRG